jgi:hypothetical protein
MENERYLPQCQLYNYEVWKGLELKSSVKSIKLLLHPATAFVRVRTFLDLNFKMFPSINFLFHLVGNMFTHSCNVQTTNVC